MTRSLFWPAKADLECALSLYLADPSSNPGS